MKKIGGAEIIEEKDLTPETLLQTVNELFDGGKLSEMKSNLQKLKNFCGNEKLLKLILKILKLETAEE